MPNRAEDLRAALRDLTGYAPAGPAPRFQVQDIREEDGLRIEDLVLDGPAAIPATFLRPDHDGRFPAVLYCHAHGGDYALGRRELVDGSRYLQAPGYGRALAAMGFAALCIDMPGFGDRRGEGSEAALAKAALWRGSSLFAVMLGDLARALAHLGDRPDTRPDRIFTLGLSMGAAHAMWLAALEPGIAGCVQHCMLADVAGLIRTGDHDRHGIYLTLPGFLGRADMGDVAGLVAPRPQLICHGTDDPLTPPAARDTALRAAAEAYAAQGAGTLQTLLEPNSGHIESPSMRVAALDFLSHATERPAFFDTRPKGT